MCSVVMISDETEHQVSTFNISKIIKHGVGGAHPSQLINIDHFN